MHDICLPIGINKNEVSALEKIIERSNVINKDQLIFKTNETFKFLFAIKTGSVKTFTVNEDGTEQITGFYLPGDVLGLDSIYSEKHNSSAITLETTSLCLIPFNNLEHIAEKIPNLGKQLLKVISKELQHENQTVGFVVNKSAETRLASFISSIAKRFKVRGYSSKEFLLSMQRKDIANYLGLTIETVSRLFTRLQKEQLIKVNRRQITILNPRGLCKLTGNNCSEYQEIANNNLANK